MGNSAFVKLFGTIEYVETKYKSIKEIEVMDMDRNEVKFPDLVDLTDGGDPKLTESVNYLVINIASQNMNSRAQIEALNANLSNFRSGNIQVIGVPSNTFHNEPNNFKSIQEIFSKKMLFHYPMISKLEVNGAYVHPLYKWLKKNSQSKWDKQLLQGKQISGDFTKVIFFLNKNSFWFMTMAKKFIALSPKLQSQTFSHSYNPNSHNFKMPYFCFLKIFR